MDESGKVPFTNVPEAGEYAKSSISEVQKPDVKGTVKDSVFRDLFGDRRYALQLYQALHPEDKKVREEDLKTVTLENIFTDSIYNDLGFIKGNKLMVLVEA